MTDELIDILLAWATSKPSVIALYVFGSRARGDEQPAADLDIALELEARFGDLDELITNRAVWKRELTMATGILVKDIQLRADPEVTGRIVTVYRRA